MSDANFAVCQIPPLSTSYSTTNYKISEARDLTGTIFPEFSDMLHDGHTVESYDTGNAQTCEFGMTFKEGHVGVLDEAKIFINFMTDKTPYIDSLSFQGSNDNFATFTSLHTFSEELHEGWNYIDYREESDVKPAYNSYRFYGEKAGACRVTEYKLHGVEAMNDDSDSITCNPKVFIGTTELTSTMNNEIKYSAIMTPKLTKISPRYGSVLGGTTVTLTGENLVGTGDASVFFDNRVCTV